MGGPANQRGEAVEQAGPEGGGRDMGHGWAKNQKWAKVQEIMSFRILFGIWIFGKLWKFVLGDLEEILTWGFFLKSSRLLKDF
jgi:hypothetical protein